MQWKHKIITTQLKSNSNINKASTRQQVRRERDRRVTALLDLDLAAEYLNCNNNLILFRHIWKNLASYMRRYSVNENPTVNKSYTYTYTKAVYIDNLLKIIKSITISVNRAYAVFNHSMSVMFGNVR